MAVARPIFHLFSCGLNPLAATNEVHVPAFVVEILDKKQHSGCLVFMKRATPRRHRTGATTVDSEILEAHRDRIKADSALG